MSFLTNWKARVTGAMRSSRKTPWAMINQRNIPPVLGTADFLLAYESSPWVRATAGKVAQAVGQTKWKLIRTDSEKEVKKHLFLDTLRRPNNLMSGNGLLRVTQLCLDLTGDAFWFLERNGLGAPVAFWPLPTHWVADLPSFDRPSFRLSYMSWQAEVPEREIVWFHDASPYNPYGRGHGIIQALADEVTGDEFASKHANQIFFNRAAPEFVVMDEGSTDDEISVHESAWNARLRGLYRAMKPYFTNRKLEFWQPNQQNLENLTLIGLRTFERDIQLQTWGIPPEQLGITTSSNRATAETSDYIFESRVVKPRREFLAEELTLKLMGQYDERLTLTFVDTSPRDKEHTLRVMTSNPVAFKINEWREQAGLPLDTTELGDAYSLPLNHHLTLDPLAVEERPGQPGMAAPPSTGGEPKKEEPEEDEDEKEEKQIVFNVQLPSPPITKRVIRDEHGRADTVVETYTAGGEIK